jgi:hypothetical protein
VRRTLRRLFVLGAMAGAGLALRNYLLRNYLENSAGPKKGDVQIVLENGSTIEPDPKEFADIARQVLQISVQAR